MWCYDYVYTATGEVDWDKTNWEEPTCATYEEGCPCNPDWEILCDSMGYKYCEQKSIGCYDPYDVTCMDSEVKCQDSWGSWCQDASWGCPLFCNGTATCYHRSYDAFGFVDWTVPETESCAPKGEPCACLEQFEHLCTDQWGNSQCTPKTENCPLACEVNEMVCHGSPYGPDGHLNFSLPYNETCHPMDQPCPCNPVHEHTCHDVHGMMGSWCWPKVDGNCPVTCDYTNEITCWLPAYDANGEMNYDVPWNQTCAPMAEGCPCHPQWEKTCNVYGYEECYHISWPCPEDCGIYSTCWHHSGNQTCRTDTGCVCEADEISCADPDTGHTNCYAKEWYPDGCPLSCKMSEMYCESKTSFDASGMALFTDFYCLDGESNGWCCPEVCDEATSQVCGQPGTCQWCASKDETCPLSCSMEEQICWVDDFDADGMWLDYTEMCVPLSEKCPCGKNAVQCTDPYYGNTFCASAKYGCPVTCNPFTEMTCFPVPYSEDGVQDWMAPVEATCVNLTQQCGCGANGKMCRYVDDWGLPNEQCFWVGVDCPATCAADEQRCYIQDYESNGHLGPYRETCAKADKVCPCGANSQMCHDPYWDYHYCYPLVDWYTGSPMRCPLYCTTEEDYCFSPSFDATGAHVSTEEYCVAKGEPCACRGQNSRPCVYEEYNWIECIPSGGYCPTGCDDDKVACQPVIDYFPNGTFLGSSAPSESCAASEDLCPCGKEAKRCPTSPDQPIGCVPKDEDCPLICGAEEKKCFIEDFTADEEYISDRELCVPKDAACPCGKHTERCPGLGCRVPSEAAVLCACPESQKKCEVDDYTQLGKLANVSLQCVNKGVKCPCGKNTLTCPNPNDASENDCPPKYHGTLLNSCPKACTAEQEAEGNVTCVQMHLSESGEFLSESTNCVRKSNCRPGQNMHKCPNGAVIPVSKQCKDPLGILGKNSTAVESGVEETATIIITFMADDGDLDDKLEKLEDVKAKLIGELQPPSNTNMKVRKFKKRTNRRLSSRRAQAASTAGMLTVEISNQGSSVIAPRAIAEHLKMQVKSGSTGVTNALASLGAVDVQAGVGLSTEKRKVTSRAEVAEQQRKVVLGITTPAPQTPNEPLDPGFGSEPASTTTDEDGNGPPGTTEAETSTASINSAAGGRATSVLLLAATAAWAC